MEINRAPGFTFHYVIQRRFKLFPFWTQIGTGWRFNSSRKEAEDRIVELTRPKKVEVGRLAA